LIIIDEFFAQRSRKICRIYSSDNLIAVYFAHNSFAQHFLNAGRIVDDTVRKFLVRHICRKWNGKVCIRCKMTVYCFLFGVARERYQKNQNPQFFHYLNLLMSMVCQYKVFERKDFSCSDFIYSLSSELFASSGNLSIKVLWL